MSKPKIKEVIIVEGKYDKNTLLQVVDATVLETGGFSIFNNDEKKELFRQMAEKRGLIVFTDSDGAGFVIRNHLKGIIPKDQLKQAYIPDIYGKEKRKTSPGKEGKIGVEGMPPEIIISSLKNCGAIFLGEENITNNNSTKPISEADFLDLGLIGEGSKSKRETLMKKLNLPQHLSTKALIDILNVIYTREEFLSLVF